MKKLIVIGMLGWNRLSGSDQKHKMKNIDNLIGAYDIKWLTGITNREKTNSTPIYEALKFVDEFLQNSSLSADDVQFVFGRGAPFWRTERALRKTMEILATRKEYKDAKVVVVGKSYGCIDTLRSIKKSKKTLKIDLAIFLDAYAAPLVRHGITKKNRGGAGNSFRSLIIPDSIAMAHVVRQNGTKYFGHPADVPYHKGDRVRNILVDWVPRDLYYTGYEMGCRKLKVSHFDMDEIPAVMRLNWGYPTQRMTYPELVKYHLGMWFN